MVQHVALISKNRVLQKCYKIGILVSIKPMKIINNLVMAAFPFVFAICLLFSVQKSFDNSVKLARKVGCCAAYVNR